MASEALCCVHHSDRKSARLGCRATSHDLVLSEAAVRVGVHAVTAARREVLDVTQAQRTAAVLVALELGNGGLGGVCVVEADNTAAARSAARLVLNFGLLHLANGREELNQIVVARGPRELGKQLVGQERKQQ